MSIPTHAETGPIMGRLESAFNEASAFGNELLHLRDQGLGRAFEIKGGRRNTTTMGIEDLGSTQRRVTTESHPEEPISTEYIAQSLPTSEIDPEHIILFTTGKILVVRLKPTEVGSDQYRATILKQYNDYFNPNNIPYSLFDTTPEEYYNHIIQNNLSFPLKVVASNSNPKDLKTIDDKLDQALIVAQKMRDERDLSIQTSMKSTAVKLAKFNQGGEISTP